MIGNPRVTFSAAALGLLAIGSFVQTANADIIFDQCIGTPENGYYSDAEGGSSLYRQADDFHLDFDANTITDIHWWGGYGNGNNPTTPDNFTIPIFESSAGLPAGDPIFELTAGNVGRVDTGFNVLNAFDL